MLLIRGGRVIDPSQDLDETTDLLIEDGRVVAMGSGLAGDAELVNDVEILDATGMVVSPGFVDLNCHLCEPGGENRETIVSGARAAVAGGFTSICAMPDTDPPVDDSAAVGFVVAEGKKAAAARVYPVATLSAELQGDLLSEFGEVIWAGAIAVSDASQPVSSSTLMRGALEYAQTFDVPVVSFPEDRALCVGGVMHEGVMATKLGLRGKPAGAEVMAVARDLALVEMTGGRLHLQRLSTGASLDLVRRAKAAGLDVTVDVTPHHLLLTDEDVEGYGTEYKVDPPLRPYPELEALRQGLVDGTIDAIATDHTPCYYDEKEQAFDAAPFGVVGLETAFSVLHTRLVREGLLELADLIRCLSTGPATSFALAGGSLKVGAPADVVIIDPEAVWTVEAKSFVSKSLNTPFEGWELQGRVVQTLVDGRTVWRLK